MCYRHPAVSLTRFSPADIIETKEQLCAEYYGREVADMFANKVVVITGGADGIGKCIGEEFQKEGIQIVYFPYTKGTSSTILREKLSK